MKSKNLLCGVVFLLKRVVVLALFSFFILVTFSCSTTNSDKNSQTNQPPIKPHTPSPSDGSTNQPLDITLSWFSVDYDNDDSITYDVYFKINNPDLTYLDLIAETLIFPSFTIPERLQLGKNYYWRIIAKDNHNATTPGPIWTFKTEDVDIKILPPISDGVSVFADKSYNQLDPGIVPIVVELTIINTSDISIVQFYIDGILKNDAKKPNDQNQYVYNWDITKESYYGEHCIEITVRDIHDNKIASKIVNIKTVESRVGKNLLANSSADYGTINWTVYGVAGTDIMPVSGKTIFYTEDNISEAAYMFQDVILPSDLTGKYLLIIGYGWVEYTVVGSITRHPYLYAYDMNSQGIILNYLQGQNMLHIANLKVWQTMYGIFQLGSDSDTIRYFINQASQVGDDSDGTRAAFDDLELRIFDTIDDAIAYRNSYISNHPVRYENGP